MTQIVRKSSTKTKARHHQKFTETAKNFANFGADDCGEINSLHCGALYSGKYYRASTGHKLSIVFVDIIRVR